MKPLRCRACYVERATTLCRECSAPLCAIHAYADKSAPPTCRWVLCAACYEKMYGRKPWEK